MIIFIIRNRLLFVQEQMVYAQPRICPGEWDTQIPRGFEIQTNPQISARRPDNMIINKKEVRLQNCGLRCPGGPESKIERMWK